ncbi:MAG: hypothetical protein LBQ54_05410 [Planctomycetaceae bacterium]|jgi:type III restriction enzyme|nr:hypothetical protein [Planctomycetaceae bacterium]
MEFYEAKKINDFRQVDSFVKNDHLGFVIYYNYQGVIRKYIPDYLIRLKNGNMLVLEVKGRDTDQDRTKREFLNEWCAAVSQDGHFGKWSCQVSFDANDPDTILETSG